MAMLVWSEKYSVNIREIDDQHRRLIGMVGQLHEAMRQGKGKEALGTVLRDLIQYVKTHFATEERLMRANGYPDHDAHKVKHDGLTRKVAEIYKQYPDGKVAMTLEVMDFLENWVDSHILGTDKQYAPFLSGKGIR